MAGLEEFQRAILLTFDPGADPAQRREANASLDALKAAAEGWRFCFQAFVASEVPQVKFWCLQTLVTLVSELNGERYVALPEPQKAELRASLIAWVQAKGAMQTDEPPFIKNKFAQLVVGVMCTDYPHAWPHVFAQLLSFLPNGPVAIDLFLRVLNTVHEEVVSAEGSGHDAQLAARIKDTMRADCLPQLVGAWASILQLHGNGSNGDGNGGTDGTHTALCAACLRTMHLHISWIDIALVTSPNIMQRLLAFVREPALHEGACLCLTEMVLKRMDVAAKLPHLQRLDIARLLAEAASSELVLTAPLATLASSLALELLNCWDSLSSLARDSLAQSQGTEALASQAAMLLGQTIPLLLRCLEADDIEASQSSLSFLHSYVGRLRKLLHSPKQLAEHEMHLEPLLQALAHKSIYPADFCFEHEDEAEATFVAYRRELGTLFKGVARLHGRLAQDFVARLLQATTKVAGVPWAHLEVALWLLYQLGEGLPEAAQKDKHGPLQGIVAGLVGFGGEVRQQHASVQILYLELLVRYHRVLLATPALLGSAFHCFLDERGVYNARRDVRTKACYLLLRLVKHTLRASDAHTLDAIISRLLALLLLQQQPAHTLTSAPDAADPTASTAAGAGAVESRLHSGSRAAEEGGGMQAAAQSLQLSDAEQMHLYEACGVLLGAGLVPPDRVSALLSSILQLPLQQLQGLCAQSAHHSATAAAHAARLGGGEGGGEAACMEQMLAAGAAAAAQHIAVVAVISKGFSNLAAAGTEQFDAQRPLREAFSNALGLSLSALHGFGKFPELRTSALMLMHRMVEMLSDDPIVSVISPALPQLLSSAESKEVVEVSRLVNQLVLKFKGRIAQPVSSMLAHLTAATFAHIALLDGQIVAEKAATDGAARAGGPQSQYERERHSLLRSYYGLLHSLVHSELFGVLTDGANAPHVEAALRVLLQGCTEGPDLQLMRQCLLVLHRLVEEWCGGGPAAVAGFGVFALQQILPVCFAALSAPHFNLNNAAALQLLDSIVALQKAMLTLLGAQQLVPYLRDTHLPSLGCEPAFCAHYVALLTEGEPRQLRDFLQQQMTPARPGGGGGAGAGAAPRTQMMS